VTADEARILGDAVEPSAAYGWRFFGAMKKSEDGACGKLNAENLCDCYETRPEACRQWASETPCPHCNPEEFSEWRSRA
jgi:Fe-S-cluster containining protein